MRKTRIKIVTLTIFFLFSFIGCYEKNNIQDTIKFNNEKIPLIHNEVPTETVSVNNVIGAQKESESSLKSGVSREENQDLKKYLRRMWILEEGENFIDYRYSFVFTSIDNDWVEGFLSTDTNVGLYYWGTAEFLEKYGTRFSGTFENGEAKCSFTHNGSSEGTIIFYFQENNKIEAKIEYVSVQDEDEKRDSERSYQFIPYTIRGYADQFDSYQKEWLSTEPDSKEVKFAFIINENKNVSFATELDSWGHVNIVSGTVVADIKFYPVVLIANDKDEILYNISLINGLDIIEVVVEDSNGDGLKDIRITLGYSETSDNLNYFKPIWVFYQTENGMFYKDESEKRYMKPEE